MPLRHRNLQKSHSTQKNHSACSMLVHATLSVQDCTVSSQGPTSHPEHAVLRLRRGVAIARSRKGQAQHPPGVGGVDHAIVPQPR